jgi:hypothetical protein
MKTCYVELKGGLGNQLFQVQAGVHYAAINNMKLKVRVKEHANRHQNSSVKSFSNYSLRIKDFQNSPSKSDIRFFGITLNKLSKIMGWEEINESAPEIAREPSQLLRIKPARNVILNGYFQSAKFFSQSRSVGLSLNPILLNESLWFKEMSDKFQSECPIAMHIRRGDYTDSPQWGMLGMKYYQEAIDYLEPINKRKIYIFTDDVSRTSKEIMNSELLNRVELVNPPLGTPAAEILMLISKAKSIVTANSTFSIWSALLATDADVVVPSQFYKRDDPNTERYMSTWHKVLPNWLSS